MGVHSSFTTKLLIGAAVGTLAFGSVAQAQNLLADIHRMTGIEAPD